MKRDGADLVQCPFLPMIPGQKRFEKYYVMIGCQFDQEQDMSEGSCTGLFCSIDSTEDGDSKRIRNAGERSKKGLSAIEFSLSHGFDVGDLFSCLQFAQQLI